MAHQLDVFRGDEQQKLSSAGFIGGAVVIIVCNLWVTLVGLGDPLQALDKFSKNIRLLQAVALLITLGWWAVMIGVVGVYRSIQARGAVWARLGMYFAIMGSTLWTLGMALDITYSNLIANWLSAPESGKEFARSLITIYSPVNGIGRGLFPMNVMANWLAFGFLSIGMIRSAIYPRWLGWVGMVLGAAGLVMGAVMVFVGREAIWNYFTVLAFLSILWVFSLGTWIARKSWAKQGKQDEMAAQSLS